MSVAVGAFEVVRFEAVPAAAGVALLELDGSFAGPIPTRPRLLVEWHGRSVELPAVVDGGSPHAWSATFAVPIEALDSDDPGFGLVNGRGPVIALPAPDLASGDDDRFVRLARVANDLRHRLAQAAESVATAGERQVELASERDALVAEIAALRERAETAEKRIEELHAEAAAARGAREEADRATIEASSELDAVRTQLAETTTRAEAAEENHRLAETLRDDAVAEAAALHEQVAAGNAEATGLREQLVAAEDEVRSARRELRDARARLEALRRASRTTRTAPLEAVEETASAPLEWDDAEPVAGPDRDDRFTADDEDPTVATTTDDGEATVAVDAGDDDETSAMTVEPDETQPMSVEDIRRAEGDGTAAMGPDDVRSAEGEEETQVVPRPRTPHARRTIRLEPHADDDILQPAAVGARYIEPSTTRPPLLALTPARIAVGAAVLLLFIALAIIFAGGGLV